MTNVNDEIKSKPDYDVLKAKAKLLYFSGKYKIDIANELEIAVSTLIRWIKEGNWRAEKIDFINSQTKENLGTIMRHANADTENTLATLQIIKDKIEEALKDSGMKPHKFTDAVDTFLDTVRLEKQLKQEAFQLTFVTEMSRILREEIADDNLWERIRIRFAKLLGLDKYEKSSDKKLLITEGVIDGEVSQVS